jgi:hypothetical protein
MQAAGMDEATDPTVADFFHNKIPGSFMDSRAWCSDQVAERLPSRGNWSVILADERLNPLWPEIQSQLLTWSVVKACSISLESLTAPFTAAWRN